MSCIFLVIVSVIVLLITFVIVLIVNAFLHQYISFIHLLLHYTILLELLLLFRNNNNGTMAQCGGGTWNIITYE